MPLLGIPFVAAGSTMTMSGALTLGAIATGVQNLFGGGREERDDTTTRLQADIILKQHLEELAKERHQQQQTQRSVTSVIRDLVLGTSPDINVNSYIAEPPKDGEDIGSPGSVASEIFGTIVAAGRAAGFPRTIDPAYDSPNVTIARTGQRRGVPQDFQGQDNTPPAMRQMEGHPNETPDPSRTIRRWVDQIIQLLRSQDVPVNIIYTILEYCKEEEEDEIPRDVLSLFANQYLYSYINIQNVRT